MSFPLHLKNVLQPAPSALAEGVWAGSGLLSAMPWRVHVTQTGLDDI